MVFQAPSKPMTIDEFIAYALLPENAERNFEFIGGEIIEKMPGLTENSGIAYNIGIETALHCRQNNILHFLTGEAGAYRIGNNTLVPDFAYKTTSLSTQYPDPVPPL